MKTLVAVCLLLTCNAGHGQEMSFRTEGGKLFRSDDAGSTWSVVDLRTGARFVWQQPGKLMHVVVAGDGVVMHSGDGGKNWRTAHFSPPEHRAEHLVGIPGLEHRLLYVDRVEGWNTVNRSYIWQSLNGGITWDLNWTTTGMVKTFLADSGKVGSLWMLVEPGPTTESMIRERNGERCIHGGPQGVWYSANGGYTSTHFGLPPGSRAVKAAHIGRDHQLIVGTETVDGKQQRFMVDPATGLWQRVESDPLTDVNLREE